MRRALLAALLLAAAAAVPAAGCGGGRERTEIKKVVVPSDKQASQDDPQAPASLGYPAFATKNTTRIGGRDPYADAVAAALAVFPSQTAGTRPPAVTLADGHDWAAATAAAALMAPPVRAPLLLSDGGSLPPVTQAGLKVLRPRGSSQVGGGQVIAIGDRPPRVDGLRNARVRARAPGDAALAAAIDRYVAALRGRPSSEVLVVAADAPRYGAPAAAWAAKSGDPVLFVGHDSVPAATREALAAHGNPNIYVLGPRQVVGEGAIAQLRRLGHVVRIGGADPVATSIAFARYTDGRFGWGVVDPGHGLVFVDQRRPLDGPAASALSASGTYGPVVLLAGPDTVPPAVRSFLLDIQPGYRRDPVRGVYNHGWLIGDEHAISLAVQAKLDQLLEISPVSARK